MKLKTKYDRVKILNVVPVSHFIPGSSNSMDLICTDFTK